MKLTYIKILNFKNLKDFEFDFGSERGGLITVLLGKNGSGKSNLLEALVVIFRDLFLGRASPFGYELRYRLRKDEAEISIKNTTPPDIANFSFAVRINGKETLVKQAQLRSGAAHKWLPRHVFAYYSGPSDRLEEHFREHQRKFYKELLAGKDRPFRPLFYARPVHSQFVLLSFFTSRDDSATKFLKDHFAIEGLDSALFTIHEPGWGNNRHHPDGDERFWGARGVVARFLARIYDYSMAPLRVTTRVEAPGLERPKATDLLHLYLPTQTALQQIAEGESAANFFKELESTYISDLIHELRIRVRTTRADGSLTFRELSEGEQQLLTVVGLLRFTREEEALFLLDEPDTHLNPDWGMQYLDILREIAEPGSDSQVIMATHDPLVLTGLTRDEVVVMERASAAGRIEASRPDVDPQGLGVVGILRSSMFGLRTTLDLPTQSKLDRRFELMAKGEAKNELEESELKQLSADLAALGFANEFRDANYDTFAKAMAKVRHSGRTTLSKSELTELEQEAEDIVRQMTAEAHVTSEEGLS